jgi:hypothetical protein
MLTRALSITLFAGRDLYRIILVRVLPPLSLSLSLSLSLPSLISLFRVILKTSLLRASAALIVPPAAEFPFSGSHRDVSVV